MMNLEFVHDFCFILLVMLLELVHDLFVLLVMLLELVHEVFTGDELRTFS